LNEESLPIVGLISVPEGGDYVRFSACEAPKSPPLRVFLLKLNSVAVAVLIEDIFSIA
jgi:hypothetical protein